MVCPKSVQPYVETYMNLSRFLQRYREVDQFDHYVITQLPSPMADDVGVVRCWNCGSRRQEELDALPELKVRITKFTVFLCPAPVRLYCFPVSSAGSIILFSCVQRRFDYIVFLCPA
eukprot:SAG31_NODE_8195_length_1498_cov_1.918513_1_plen_116_part_10